MLEFKKFTLKPKNLILYTEFTMQLCNLLKGPTNYTIWPWQDFTAFFNVTLEQLRPINKLQRTRGVINMAPTTPSDCKQEILKIVK